MACASWLLNLDFAGSIEGVGEYPGVEIRHPGDRLHYKNETDPPHYRHTGDRLHYTNEEAD